MSLTAGTTTLTSSSGTVQPVVSANQLQALAEVCSTVRYSPKISFNLIRVFINVGWLLGTVRG